MEPNFTIEVHNAHIHLRCAERFAALLAVSLICFALHCVALLHCFALRCLALLFCFALICFGFHAICFALHCDAAILALNCIPLHLLCFAMFCFALLQCLLCVALHLLCYGLRGWLVVQLARSSGGPCNQVEALASRWYIAKFFRSIP